MRNLLHFLHELLSGSFENNDIKILGESEIEERDQLSDFEKIMIKNFGEKRHK